MKKAVINAKWLLIAFVWMILIALSCVMVFSVYPNYLLRGHYGKLFVQLRHLSDSIVYKVLPQKINSTSSIILDESIIEPKFEGGIPPRVNQPLVVTLPPGDVPKTAYFSEPRSPIMFGPAMVPDPYTNYAPLPGKIIGMVTHNSQQFRYPEDLEKKKNNEVRIFITGGSVAWGACATGLEATIAGCMEKELRKKYSDLEIRVVTAAAGAWVSTQERIWIFNRITEYDPDIIISYSGFNDLESYRLKEDLYDRYGYDGKYFRHAIKYYDQYNRGEEIAELAYNDTGSRFKDADFPRKTLKNTKIISGFLKSIGVKYIYVLQPVGEKNNTLINDIYKQLGQEKADKAKGEIAQYYELYKQLGSKMAIQAKREGYQYIDHSGLLNGRPEMFVDFCHPGDRGYQVIANDLISKIDLDSMVLQVKSGK